MFALMTCSASRAGQRMAAVRSGDDRLALPVAGLRIALPVRIAEALGILVIRGQVEGIARRHDVAQSEHRGRVARQEVQLALLFRQCGERLPGRRPDTVVAEIALLLAQPLPTVELPLDAPPVLLFVDLLVVPPLGDVLADVTAGDGTHSNKADHAGTGLPANSKTGGRAADPAARAARGVVGQGGLRRKRVILR
ncbi:hypothetical protein ASD78_01440 [Lysobacter sp. Root667]|nr:hypothetical protein ASD78_01440 [Lysobacter sp. Root667]